ncbi:Uncharacterised protein [Citrobacter koseri]|nr:Uncharacterised protein [Citrobacter koseri]
MKVVANQYNLATAINKSSAVEQTRTVAQEGTKIERSAADRSGTGRCANTTLCAAGSGYGARS